MSEPIDPVPTPEWIKVSRAVAEPIGAAETINKSLGRLVKQLVGELQRRGLGVRRTAARPRPSAEPVMNAHFLGSKCAAS
jgi:hypothetical protein